MNNRACARVILSLQCAVAQGPSRSSDRHPVPRVGSVWRDGRACTGAQAAEQEAGDTFRIGIITSLTGPAAAFGQAHKNGYTIALSELNASGRGAGQADRARCTTTTRAVPTRRCKASTSSSIRTTCPIILGAYSSENTRAIVPAVTQKQVPLVMPTATADNVLETGSPWVFRDLRRFRAPTPRRRSIS